MQMMADTHVHIYPFHDAAAAVGNLRANLAAGSLETACLAFLAERYDCSFFDTVLADQAIPGLPDASVTEVKNCLLVEEKGEPDVYLFAGRQVITHERIEILSLLSRAPIADGMPADRVLGEIEDNKGLAVLSWAPGKWLFKRKGVVERLIDNAVPGALFIGDTTLRPLGWGEPVLMRRARAKGLTILAGSDPLPFSGEENLLGRYGNHFSGELLTQDPAASIAQLFRQPGFSPEVIGRRGNPITTFKRLLANYRAKNQQKGAGSVD